ncbi:hypothetical protein Blue_045 [Bacillus phage Deep Blue]|uniref:Uncharacterized protein n=1 Tax=Bacillus phage Deep Blue TaxID=1792245 RepID=A0A140HLK6_9CAUD|nr:hypothetical protein Blue_045 [Bacillus phage Deep Blue]AMO25868.1 hypothetical protein Blue_045 [Bacillus phage Deep Blue]
MAIVSDYMTYGNCSVCGKYLSKGTLCCDKMVKSNYDKWWQEMQEKKATETSTLTINVRKRSIGTGIRGIKDIMKDSGPKYFADIVENNKRLREDEKNMNTEKYLLRVYNASNAMVQEHEETEKYQIMNRIYSAISDPKFILQDMDIVKLGTLEDSMIIYKLHGRFVR